MWLRQEDNDLASDSFLSRERGTIYLRQDVEDASAAFMLATQVAVIEHSELLERIIKDAKFQTSDAEQLCRMALANYFAGALLLPYSTFSSPSPAQCGTISRCSRFASVQISST